MTEEENATTKDSPSSDGNKDETKHDADKIESSDETKTETDHKQETTPTASEHKVNKDDKETSKDGDADKDGEGSGSKEVQRKLRSKGPTKVKVTRTVKEPPPPTSSGITRRKVTNNKLAPVVKGKQKTHVKVSSDQIQDVETFGRRVMTRFGPRKFW